MVLGLGRLGVVLIIGVGTIGMAFAEVAGEGGFAGLGASAIGVGWWCRFGVILVLAPLEHSGVREVFLGVHTL